MAKIVGHLETVLSGKSGWIVETGTARVEGCWEGHGQSTLIWDWLAEKLSPRLGVISIDLVQEHIQIAQSQVSRVTFIRGDSVQMLSGLSQNLIEKTALLYLDSFDWTPELAFESAAHPLCELTTVWAHLPSGCLVVVDDRHSAHQGKHVMVDGFMRKMGIEPLFAEYQIGWIKP